jgi:hypothetical protein
VVAFSFASGRVWLSDVLALTLVATLVTITSGVDTRSNLAWSAFFSFVVVGSL